jgi:hypothetical protein
MGRSKAAVSFPSPAKSRPGSLGNNDRLCGAMSSVSTYRTFLTSRGLSQDGR